MVANSLIDKGSLMLSSSEISAHKFSLKETFRERRYQNRSKSYQNE